MVLAAPDPEANSRSRNRLGRGKYPPGFRRRLRLDAQRLLAAPGREESTAVPRMQPPQGGELGSQVTGRACGQDSAASGESQLSVSSVRPRRRRSVPMGTWSRRRPPLRCSLWSTDEASISESCGIRRPGLTGGASLPPSDRWPSKWITWMPSSRRRPHQKHGRWPPAPRCLRPPSSGTFDERSARARSFHGGESQ